MPTEKITKINGRTGQVVKETDVVVSQDEVDAPMARTSIEPRFRQLRQIHKQLADDFTAFDTMTAAQRAACQKRMLAAQLLSLRLLRDFCLASGFRQEDDV